LIEVLQKGVDWWLTTVVDVDADGLVLCSGKSVRIAAASEHFGWLTDLTEVLSR